MGGALNNHKLFYILKFELISIIGYDISVFLYTTRAFDLGEQ